VRPLEASARREQANRLAKVIHDRRNEICAALARTTTWSAATKEIEDARACLLGAADECQEFRSAREELALFMPSNNLLYSFVMFAVVPSLYPMRVHVRPSSRNADVFSDMYEILSKELPDHIHIQEISQRKFLRLVGPRSVVVFNGRYENAELVATSIDREALFLAFGSGPNPTIIGPTADLCAAMDDVVSARLYNSGQDCLASDIHIVHQSRLDEFLHALTTRLRTVSIGDAADPTVTVAGLSYADAFQSAAAYLRGAANVLYGGAVDVATRLVEPSVVLHSTTRKLVPPEFFSPIFAVAPYTDASELKEWFTTPLELRRGMYAGIFGEPRLRGEIVGTTNLCHESTPMNAENGNLPFGGYGVQASSVGVGADLHGRPLLLSAELTREHGALL
jgi:acyl-CoA reductase-like NAD-dependent aldehyde dehydrogenase